MSRVARGAPAPRHPPLLRLHWLATAVANCVLVGANWRAGGIIWAKEGFVPSLQPLPASWPTLGLALVAGPTMATMARSGAAGAGGALVERALRLVAYAALTAVILHLLAAAAGGYSAQEVTTATAVSSRRRRRRGRREWYHGPLARSTSYPPPFPTRTRAPEQQPSRTKARRGGCIPAPSADWLSHLMGANGALFMHGPFGKRAATGWGADGALHCLAIGVCTSFCLPRPFAPAARACS